jgi:hypothetical protein
MQPFMRYDDAKVLALIKHTYVTDFKRQEIGNVASMLSTTNVAGGTRSIEDATGAAMMPPC